MCGIMGYEGKDISLEEFEKHLALTKRRGPDMSRVEETNAGYLGFNRLAIMGLTPDGMQPFHLDGSSVVCNGELYCFRPIKKKLQEKYAFKSGSDCEIILPLYFETGLDMFTEIDSEYAMIIYDARTDEFIAARDPIGIRPLFYGYSGSGKIMFASEAKNLVGLSKEIFPFPPGHYYKGGKFVCYHDIAKAEKYSQDDLPTIFEKNSR